MNMDAMERAELRNECLPIEPGDVLRFRGERLTYSRRYHRDGLRREPTYVFESDSFAGHVQGDDIKVVLPDGEATLVQLDGVDERDAIVLSER